MKLVFNCQYNQLRNKLFDDTENKNLSPLKWVKHIIGKDCITYDIFDKINGNKRDYIIIHWTSMGIFNFYKYLFIRFKYLKNKQILILKEPPVVANLQYCKILHYFFDKILTWNDDLVDNKKYFHFIYQISKNGIDVPVIPFKEKKFLTLINANKFSLHKNELYSKREEAIRYFEKNHDKKFDLYGIGWDKPNMKQKILGFLKFISYRGKVKDKIKTLSEYKFNICFENMCNVKGYITEKIWDSFKAKSVPIYRGAENITDYIPKNCFIDFRKFDYDYEKLYNFLLSMQEEEYNKYIDNIKEFLSTDEAQKWFDKKWAENFINSL